MEGRQLVGIRGVQRHQRGHEFDRVVRLEIAGPVRDRSVGRRVRLVETVTGKLSDKLENIGRLLAADPVLFGTVEETGFLLVHLLLFLLAHGAAEQIGFTE